MTKFMRCWSAGWAQKELTPLERGHHALRATTKYGTNGGLFLRLPDMPAPWLGLPRRERSDDVELEINLSETSVKAAFENLLMRDAPLRLFRDPREYRRRLDPLRATWKAEACDYMAKMRRRLRLTRRQFADLFMTSLRTVERWETHTRRPSTRHQWQLRLLANTRKGA